jgi:trehalose synthase
MIQTIEIEPSRTLDDYAAIAHFAGPVQALRAEAAMLVPPLRERTVWMVNSTAQGGGVAEMLPQMITLLNEVGLTTRWAVIGSNRPAFFALTKRVHNLIHGDGEPTLSDGDRQLFEAVNRQNVEALKPHLGPDDIVVVHDPQPLALGAILKAELGVRTVWRCHIGHDERLPATHAAWRFLKPYAETYDRAIFSAPEYIPDYLAGRATIIHPALDPYSHKNRELSPHKLVGILCNAGLKCERYPVLTPPFSDQAQRLQPDGTFGTAVEPEEIGLLYRPIVTQVSRWDRLKGLRPLLEGFVKLKGWTRDASRDWSPRRRRRVEIGRLVLAGPDPASIQDDPEGQEVLESLSAIYLGLPPEIQRDVALLTLPMQSRKQNALMVNALQRCSTIIVQNSIREGFGLTATEAMWKCVPVLGTRASGLRQQIRSGIDGILTQDASDPDEVARRLDEALCDLSNRDLMARSAQRRVHDHFLIFTQLCEWLRVLSAAATSPRKAPAKDD